MGKAVNSLLEMQYGHLRYRIKFKDDGKRDIDVSNRPVYFDPGLYPFLCRIFGIQKNKQTVSERIVI